jgi:hypothetical protein
MYPGPSFLAITGKTEEEEGGATKHLPGGSDFVIITKE